MVAARTVRAAMVLGEPDKDLKNVEPPPGSFNTFLLGGIRHNVVDEDRPSLLFWHTGEG